MSRADSRSDRPPPRKVRTWRRAWGGSVLFAAGLVGYSYVAQQSAENRFWSDLEDTAAGELAHAPQPIISVEPSITTRDNARCEERLREVLQSPGLAAPPTADRLAILGRVKAEPALFVQAPEYSQEEVRPQVVGLRHRYASSHPYTALKEMRTHFSNFHEDARQVLLKDGYLYAENADQAFAIATQVEPRHLFGHEKIWLQRGERTYWGKRTASGDYVYASGELEGDSIDLMPWDRVGAGEPPAHALHRDLRSLQYRLHFTRMQIRHVTETSIVANLRYGRWWVPSVLKSQGAHLDLECEIASHPIREEMTKLRERGAQTKQVLSVVRSTILQEIDERLPFDEPRREFGLQLDGKLRTAWFSAYRQHKRFYNYNGDRYAVFDEQGRPYVPQVCVDFLTDTFERASGTWFTAHGETPQRVAGRLLFSDMHHPDLLRQVSGFVGFTEAHPEMFDVYVPPWQERVKLGAFPAFLEYLKENADEYQPGDMVLIRGKTPWDPKKAHYHSFIVYENDPLTGVPLYVAGNPGRPVIRAWETEAERTPLRKVVLRVRPKLEWLQKVITPPGGAVLDPPDLGPGRG